MQAVSRIASLVFSQERGQRLTNADQLVNADEMGRRDCLSERTRKRGISKWAKNVRYNFTPCCKIISLFPSLR